MTREERALPLLELVSQAAIDSNAWHGFVKAVSEAFRGAAVRLAFSVTGDPPGGEHYCVGLAPELQGAYLQKLMGGLPWGTELGSRYATEWVHFEDLFPDVDLRRTAFYRSWMRPQKLAAVWPMGSAILDEEGLPIGGLTLFRPAGSRAFTQADGELGALILPFVERAVQVQSLIGGVRRERVALAEAMDRLPTGFVLLDEKRQPVVTNRSAQRILDERDGIEIGPSGPFAANPRNNQALRELVDRALHPEPGREVEAGGFLSVERPSGRRALVVMVSPLEGGPESGASDRAAVAMFLGDPEGSHVSAKAALETLYELTPAEAELVTLLSTGLSLEQVAERRGVTMNTARSQLKHVFAKTDTRRQGELVRLVLTGVASIRGH